MTTKPEWTIYRRPKRKGKRGREFILKRIGSPAYHGRPFTNCRLRRLGDALQDAIDGTQETTHEWSITRNWSTDVAVLDNGRIQLNGPTHELERLVEMIDNLLEE